MAFALVGAGRVSGTFVSQLPSLPRELGPVAAKSYRLASRIANTIGAGYPVRSFSGLKESSLVLITVPPASLDSHVAGLAAAMDWRRKTVLLCESGADSSSLARLRNLGAWVGSMQAIGGFDRWRFVAEGCRPAVRQAMRLGAQLDARVEEVRTSKVGLYQAALSFGSGLFTPLMEAMFGCLLEAGITGTSAAKITETIFHRSVRAYAYSGKRSWNGPLADGDPTAIRKELDSLSQSNPLFARYYREAAIFALDHFKRHPALKRTLEEYASASPRPTAEAEKASSAAA